MSEEIKPTGYCAWDSKLGIFEVALSRGSLEERITDVKMEQSTKYEQYKAKLEAELAFCFSHGLVIKPVNIVEHEEYCRLKKLEEWAEQTRKCLVCLGGMIDNTDDPTGLGWQCSEYDAITSERGES